MNIIKRMSRILWENLSTMFMTRSVEPQKKKCKVLKSKVGKTQTFKELISFSDALHSYNAQHQLSDFRSLQKVDFSDEDTISHTM